MELTFYEIADVVNAQNDYKKWDDFALTGVEFDSRKIEEGNLFMPLAGEHDGHDYVDSAIENGAAAALWSNQTTPNLPFLQVDDVLEAMKALAHYYRRKKNPQVIAITGSNGKTTTKDMTATVLSTSYNMYKTQGNYNNEIGLPYTILHMPDDTEMLVLEMGMDGAHQIDELSIIAEPDIACITMVGESHIENLGSRENIAKAKMEICTGLKAEGTLIIPDDEPLLLDLAEKSMYRYVTCGFTENADLQGHIVDMEQKSTLFTTNFNSEEMMIPVPGAYNVRNALIAMFVAILLKVPFASIRIGLSEVQLTKSRTEWLRTKGGTEILSDVYNANPTAMRLVLENFASIDTNYRKMLVLGDMLELGELSREMHESLAPYINPNDFEEVFLYGPEMSYLFDVLVDKFGVEHLHYYETRQKEFLMMDVKDAVNYDVMILLKGSNGMGLKEVVDYLMQ